MVCFMYESEILGEEMRLDVAEHRHHWNWLIKRPAYIVFLWVETWCLMGKEFLLEILDSVIHPFHEIHSCLEQSDSIMRLFNSPKLHIGLYRPCTYLFILSTFSFPLYTWEILLFHSILIQLLWQFNRPRGINKATYLSVIQSDPQHARYSQLRPTTLEQLLGTTMPHWLVCRVDFTLHLH